MTTSIWGRLPRLVPFRCAGHLGLVVPGPADRCGLRIDGQTCGWDESASLLFDDTRRHEAWNDTEGDRGVLLLDVKRPLPAPLRWINDGVVLLLSRAIMLQLARPERMVPDGETASARSRKAAAE